MFACSRLFQVQPFCNQALSLFAKVKKKHYSAPQAPWLDLMGMGRDAGRRKGEDRE